MIFELPFPPSVNGYWRNYRGRQILSKRAREYREKVLETFTMKFNGTFTGRLSVKIELFPPTRHTRDIDNFQKAILDVMTYADIWEDDSQIDILLTIRRNVIPNGKAVVTVDEFAKNESV